MTCRKMDGTGGHCAKWNKSDTNTPCSFSYLESNKSPSECGAMCSKCWEGGGEWV
jgi:hypothetical protein